MSAPIDQLVEAQKYAMSIRPKVGGFPVLAEVLRQAGVRMNRWSLPACQSTYVTDFGNFVQQGTPLINGNAEIPTFNRESLIRALRKDQEGRGSFPEFLESSWKAGVISYDVDFIRRRVIYYGAEGESYLEDYPAVEISPRS